MSDQLLRHLERKWLESGSVADEAAYLAERLRMGELDRDRLELARYCGSPAALVVLGGSASQPVPEGFREWVLGLSQWGKAVAVRAALAAAAHVLPAWRELGLGEDVPDHALHLVQSWLTSPSTELESNADAVARDCWRAYKAHQGVNAAVSAAAAACHAAEAVTRDAAFAAGVAWDAIDAASLEGAPGDLRARLDTLRQTIQRAISEWALRPHRPMGEPVKM